MLKRLCLALVSCLGVALLLQACLRNVPPGGGPGPSEPDAGTSLPADGGLLQEIATVRRIADNPVIRTGRLDPAVLASTPPGSAPEDDLPVAKQATWRTESRTLAAGESYRMDVAIPAPALLMARATWVGSPTPVKLLLLQGASTLATGQAVLAPPDRGSVSAHTQLNAAGTASVSVKNEGSVAARIELKVGVLPLSAKR